MLTTANNRPATQPDTGRIVGATPAEELDAVEEATERVAVASSVEDAELLNPDEPLQLKETAEPEGAELALTIPLIDPLVARSLADIDVVKVFELATGTGVAIETELDTGIVVAIEKE